MQNISRIIIKYLRYRYEIPINYEISQDNEISQDYEISQE